MVPDLLLQANNVPLNLKVKTSQQYAKLRALRALMACVPRALRALLSYVPRAIRALIPYVSRVLRALVPHIPRASRALCFTCLVPYVASCLALYESFFFT